MHFILIILVALLAASGATHAQTPPAPDRAAERARPKDTERAPTEDEELALAALEGLMGRPADRALPIIKKVLAGPQTQLVKQRALFVLSQIDSPEANSILMQAARSSDSALRGEAIRSIGIGGDRNSLDA